MRIFIDNLDGLGALDYTPYVCAEGPISIERTLNRPSRCVALLLRGGGGLAVPVRRARVSVQAEDDAATVLFTGYVTGAPVAMYAGTSSTGAAYKARLSAVSDEWLLDKIASGATSEGGLSLSLDGRALLQRLTDRAQNAAGPVGLSLATSGTTARAVGPFAASANRAWSANARDASNAAYAGYRALSGQVTQQPAGSVTHALSDGDGSLNVGTLTLGELRELANDVTLSGEEEPAAYVSECFAGDGTTTQFLLSKPAFQEKHPRLIEDTFDAAAFDPGRWLASDPGGHLSITSAGLTMTGGNGLDGQTTLTALDAIEMGGAIVAEMSGVMLGAASAGMIGGFYQEPIALANCFAGFRVRQRITGGVSATVIVPVVNGLEVGTVFAPLAGHAYTLRLRLHCVEMQRVRQLYYAMVDGLVETFGSLSGITAPMNLVFELVDEGAASNTPATVLYDSATATPVSTTPATCAFVAVNSQQMHGSVRSVRLTRPGSMWVTSTLPSGVRQTRLIGLAGEGVDCIAQNGGAQGGGKITFLAGRVPVAGERVTVQYRRQQRSVARCEDAASVAAEAAGGGPGTCRWLGKVEAPLTRSSADCENAALAVLAAASSRTAAVGGSYQAINPAADVWPGDLLAVTSAGVTSSLLVRNVKTTDGGSVPEVRRYEIGFSNDWATAFADGLGLKLSEAIAADATLPLTASAGAASVLDNLQQLTVTSVTTTTLQLDAGLAAPAGGGFEVRRRDEDFGIANDADLVLRSNVRSFSIPRAAQIERFYVRMYDGSTPRIYSRFSSAVFLSMPVS